MLKKFLRFLQSAFRWFQKALGFRNQTRIQNSSETQEMPPSPETSLWTPPRTEPLSQTTKNFDEKALFQNPVPPHTSKPSFVAPPPAAHESEDSHEAPFPSPALKNDKSPSPLETRPKPSVLAPWELQRKPLPSFSEPTFPSPMAKPIDSPQSWQGLGASQELRKTSENNLSPSVSEKRPKETLELSLSPALKQYIQDQIEKMFDEKTTSPLSPSLPSWEKEYQHQRSIRQMTLPFSRNTGEKHSFKGRNHVMDSLNQRIHSKIP